jgi:hypothetical protein
VDTSRRCELPFGAYSAELAAGINLFDALAHTWDVAVVSGLGLDETDGVWDVARCAAIAVVGEHRDVTQYASAVAVPSDASAMRRFLGFLGRAPGDVSERRSATRQ